MTAGLAIILCIIISYALGLYMRARAKNDRDRKRAAALGLYAKAKRHHRPSKKLWQDLHKLNTDQLRSEIK